jgi:hypothetical protein
MPAARTPATAQRFIPPAVPSESVSERKQSEVNPSLVAPHRERMKSIAELLDETLGEMRGASDVALPEALSQPGDGASLAAAKVNNPPPVASATPGAVVLAEPRVPASPTRHRPWSRVLTASTAFMASTIAIGLAWHLVYRSPGGRAAGATTAPMAVPIATVETAPPTVVSGPPLLPPPRPSTIASVAVPAATSTTSTATVGTVNVTAAGHRLFIDGRLAGEGPRTFSLPCGMHELRVGSAGATRAVNVPCGGEIVLGGP